MLLAPAVISSRCQIEHPRLRDLKMLTEPAGMEKVHLMCAVAFKEDLPLYRASCRQNIHTMVHYYHSHQNTISRLRRLYSDTIFSSFTHFLVCQRGTYASEFRKLVSRMTIRLGMSRLLPSPNHCSALPQILANCATAARSKTLMTREPWTSHGKVAMITV
jgi:hypothetical protein